MLKAGWRVCHLQIYQTTEAQILWFSPTAAAVKASFQSHLSHFSLLSSEANPHPHPVLMLKGDCSLLEEREGERWWAAYLFEGLALLKWNSLVLSDRAMEVEERRGWEDRGEGRRCVRPGPEDQKRRSSVFSFPLFFTFTSRSLLIFSPLGPPFLWSALSSSPRSRTGRSVSSASRDLPRGPQMSCQVQGLDRREQKTLKKHIRKAGTLVKCV